MSTAEPGLLPVNATLSVTVYAFAPLSEPFAVCKALLKPYVVLPTVQPLEQVVSGTVVAGSSTSLSGHRGEAATADVVGSVRVHVVAASLLQQTLRDRDAVGQRHVAHRGESCPRLQR